MDVSDLVEYNLGLLNETDLPNSFFCLSKEDPAIGFPYDASQIAGNTYGNGGHQDEVSEYLLRRLVLGSHLASYLRSEMEEHLHYTCTVGISTSKLLSKLVGNVHKPQAQTTLLPPYVEKDGGPESNVTTFIDNHDLGKIPNIGFKMAHKLREYVTQHHKNTLGEASSSDDSMHQISVRQVRTVPGMNPILLEKILGGPGMPHGVGARTWELLHGIDDTEVATAKMIPRQISIEDSYIRLDSFERVQAELLLLSKSLIKRMRTDLTEEDEESLEPSQLADHVSKRSHERRRWLALPRTLRLSTRPRPPADPEGTRSRASNRISRSIPAPNLLNNLSNSVEELASRLVSEYLVSLFRRLHPERSGWDLSLINIAVTNMTETAGNSKVATGRDISKMFKNQDNHLREWKVEDIDVPPDQNVEDSLGEESLNQPSAEYHGSEDQIPLSQASQGSYFQGGWDDENEHVSETFDSACPFCEARMPSFAMPAHLRFHESEG
jgi:DNA polymerase iota